MEDIYRTPHKAMSLNIGYTPAMNVYYDHKYEIFGKMYQAIIKSMIHNVLTFNNKKLSKLSDGTKIKIYQAPSHN